MPPRIARATRPSRHAPAVCDDDGPTMTGPRMSNSETRIILSCSTACAGRLTRRLDLHQAPRGWCRGESTHRSLAVCHRHLAADFAHDVNDFIRAHREVATGERHLGS